MAHRRHAESPSECHLTQAIPAPLSAMGMYVRVRLVAPHTSHITGKDNKSFSVQLTNTCTPCVSSPLSLLISSLPKHACKSSQTSWPTWCLASQKFTVRKSDPWCQAHGWFASVLAVSDMPVWFSAELPYGWEKIEDPQYGTYYVEWVCSYHLSSSKNDGWHIFVHSILVCYTFKFSVCSLGLFFYFFSHLVIFLSSFSELKNNKSIKGSAIFILNETITK